MSCAPRLILGGTLSAIRLPQFPPAHFKPIPPQVSGLVSGGKRPPHLTAVIVGDDKASQIYVGNKMKAAEKCGLRATILKRDSSLEQNELLDILHQLGRDELVT